MQLTEQAVKNRLFSNQDLVKLIVPMILEQLLAVLVGMADTIMVAVVGESAVASVSLVDSISMLFIFAFTALATGGAVVIGQYMGCGNDTKARKAGEQLILFMAISSMLIMVLIYLGKWLILNVVFGTIEPDVMAYANTYLLIVTASIPFLSVYNAGAAIFRVQGNSAISMKVSILMNGINVAGNAILVLGLHCKVEGVAIPTLVSRIVAAVVIIALLRNQELRIHIGRQFNFKPDRVLIKRILNVGIPNGIENSMFQLGKIVLLSLISTFGTVAITANAVGNTMASFAILPGQTIGLALITVVSRCVGAGDYDQVRYYTKKLLITTYVVHLVLNVFIILILPLITWAYQLSETTAAVTKQILLLYCIFAILIWPFSFTLPYTLRASNDAKYPMIVSLLSMWFCRIVLGYILGKYFGLGVFGVWIAMIVDWFVRSAFFIQRYIGGKWKTIKVNLN